MKIACLGWGSLIWQPGNLLIRRAWFEDGPLLPIEFTRQSKDGRLTLVINESAKATRTLWALMATDNLNDAKRNLQEREGIPLKNIDKSIGVVSANEDAKSKIEVIIKEWMQNLKIDAVIWTNLPSKFQGENNRTPTIEEAISYIKSLDINSKKNAEEYIRKTPRQIDTDYRRKIESEFGWSFIK